MQGESQQRKRLARLVPSRWQTLIALLLVYFPIKIQLAPLFSFKA